jgi:hypothetical protein
MAGFSKLPLSLLLFATQPCHAAAPPHTGLPFDNPHGIRECAGLPARLDFQPRAGRVLHAEPNDRSAPVGHLPRHRPRRGGSARTTFPLVESFDGWLLVRGGNAATGGDGWLLGLGVSTGVSADRGYSFPRTSSEVVMHSRDGARLDAHAELIDIIGCDRGWIFGRWRIDEPDELSWRQELTIWSDPPVVEFWTPACDRRARGCDTPPHSRPAHEGPRNPIPHDESGQ